MGVIYKITNLINNKIYIGQTRMSEPQRWQSHVWHAYNNPEDDCIYLCNAIKKYGKENFKREILEQVNDENLNQREIYYINYYNSTNKNIGYNICVGGNGHIKYDSLILLDLYNKLHSVTAVANELNASRDSISKRLQALGVDTNNHTVYQFNIQGELIDIYKSYAEAKRKTQLPLGHCIPRNHYSCNYFWVYEKDNLNINDIIKQYKNNTSIKQIVQQYDLNCRFIAEYESCNDASKITGINLSSLKAAANGKQITSGGYIWYKPFGAETLETKYTNYLLSRSCCEIEEVDLKGNIIKQYPSSGIAETELGWSYNSIKNVCDGKTNHTHGRIFRYSNPDKRELIKRNG